jgi:hypothetical protein
VQNATVLYLYLHTTNKTATMRHLFLPPADSKRKRKGIVRVPFPILQNCQIANMLGKMCKTPQENTYVEIKEPVISTQLQGQNIRASYL